MPQLQSASRMVAYHARITKNSMHPDIYLFVSHIMRSRLERHILVCPNNPNNHEDLLRINSAVGNTPMNIQTLPALTLIQPEVCRFIKKLFLLEDELSLTDFVHSGAVNHFEPVFGVALGNTRHWSVNGFPGRLIHIASSSIKPEVTPDQLTRVKFDAGCKEEEKSCLAGSRGAKRHIYQNGCLVNILKADKLLSTKFNYVEFGAGRGGLSHWINVCLASNATQLSGDELCRPREPTDSNFLLVEQKSMRYKFDTRNRDIGNFTRVRMDIAQLDLKRVSSFQNSCKPVVAVAKHLCGDATDLALRCLKNASTKNEKNDQVIRLGGIMFAVCCHHQCSWEEAVGRPWLEREAGLTGREFAIATRLTSWATCGFKRKQPRIVEPSPPAEVLPIHDDGSSNPACCLDELTDFSAFSMEQRIAIGRLSKRLIDWSRLCYIRNELKFPNASMCSYTSHDVTLENFVLRASNAFD
ncbi:hypothetical protein EG68_00077 [Paragonimus skrjabini miyazakii]|uniref:tRNA:m(4)X modification enzyme TRM13 n=1 Tax=Paragonimus skrjabini miyazakii TaxID=59628 RepID=A0A8S9Z574_9TREM|nr:hypothetical protein EG68_00077 [Paragonimus skrjabini miyazakii]